MNEFKLVALRPLLGCNTEYLKILKEDKTYIFYSEYDFSQYSQSKRKVTIKSPRNPDLFSIKNNYKKNIKINISAIVGENGSGKSSLVELFYLACYNISVLNEVLFDEKELRVLNSNDRVLNVNLEIFYQINEEFYLLRIIDKEITHFLWSDNIFKEIKSSEFSMNSFFYTISINYSLHALNSKHLGKWVSKIFHKNDGYQTPIVLNPYREDGIVDVNNEEYLVKYRLISNILGKNNGRVKQSDSLKNIVDNKIAHRLHVQLNRKKFKFEDDKPKFELTKEIGELVLPLVYEYFLKEKNFIPKDTLLNKYAQEYILYKLKSIASKYNPYKRLHQFFYENEQKTRDYLFMLAQDKSHVTFKLNQALNFLSNEIYFDRKEKFDLTVSYLSRKLSEESSQKERELIDILPPSFFNIDIEFKDKGMFSSLSSGEKQRIYSLATLIYHLINLSSTNPKTAIYKYKVVNIIFDELELYFHPELQRKLIYDLLESIKKIDLKDINSLNILMVTHSPFILSDIPETNILFLNENGETKEFLEEERISTFGGNIHELLSHSFFLKKGFIGEFAKEKIQKCINIITTPPEKNITKKDIKNTKEEIELIGEKFLRDKLLEMFYQRFDKQRRIAELEKELENLRQ